MTHYSPSQIQKLKTENERLRSLIRRINEGEDMWHKNIFDKSMQALAVCETFSDFPSTILDCNAEFRNLIKRSTFDIVGKDFMELMQKGEKRKFFVQAFGNTKEKDIKEFPLIFLDGKGNELTMEITTKFFETSRGRLALVKLQAENPHKSTLHNGIEQLLSNSKQIFFAIKEDEILLFDYISHSVEKVTGYSSEQLLLNPFLFWNNCHPEDLKRLKKVLSSNKEFENNLNIRFIRQDGQMIWLDFSVISNPTQIEGDQCYYAVARETTASQRKARQLKKKELYDQLILQSAQSLIGHVDSKDLKSLTIHIGNQLPVDRFSIYIHNEFSHDIFADHISTERKTYAASNATIWQELKDDFISLPVISYQSDDDNINFKPQHISFFNRVKIKSILIVPLLHQGKAFGFVACSAIIKHSRWDRTDINYISQLSQLVSQAFHPSSRA